MKNKILVGRHYILSDKAISWMSYWDSGKLLPGNNTNLPLEVKCLGRGFQKGFVIISVPLAPNKEGDGDLVSIPLPAELLRESDLVPRGEEAWEYPQQLVQNKPKLRVR